MSAPPDPAPDPDDPVEAGEAPPESTAGRGAADPDDAWEAIVANYGERPRLEDAEERLDVDPVGGNPAARSPEGDAARLRGLFEPWQRPGRPERPEAEHRNDQSDLARSHDAPFVPPDPPAPPRTSADRRAAWLGVLGAPLLLLVSLLVGIDLPQVVALALVAGFVGGFCYLVLTMSRVPRDPGDDGARV